MAVRPKPMRGSLKTEVADIGDQVLKTPERFSRFERKKDESDSEYRERRLEAAFHFIRGELESERLAMESIGQRIYTPKELHFIAKGEDGYPSPFRIQEKIVGKMLRDIDMSTLNEEQESALVAILRASIQSYLKNGRVLDLVGFSSGDDPDFWKKLRQYLHPLKSSANVLLSEDDRIVYIDVKIQNGGRLEELAKALFTIVEYWRRLLKLTLIKRFRN